MINEELGYVCVLDLETSGLNQQKDQVLELAAHFGEVNEFGFVGSRSYSAVFPLITDPDDWHPEARKMHEDNGLLELCRQVKDEEIWERVDLDLLNAAQGNKFTLMGNTVHFDLGFVRRVFPAFGRSLSHRVLDVSGARLFCESLGMQPVKPPKAHRADPDCRQSIALYGAYQNWIRNACNMGELR